MDLFVFDTLGAKEIPKNNVKYKEDQTKLINIDESKSNSSAESNCSLDLENENENENENIFLMNDSADDNSDMDFGGLGPPTDNYSRIIAECLEREKKKKLVTKSNSSSLDEFIDAMGWNKSTPTDKQKSKKHPNLFENMAQGLDTEIYSTNVKKEIEQLKNKCLEDKSTDLTKPSFKQMKKLNRVEREKTKGSNWFDLPATEVNEDIEKDLKILQMRSALDPKHFYKKNDLKVLPKYFQIGTVQHSPLDYYSERHIRKNKKKTIVDELMADAQFKQYSKRKYKEITEKNQNHGYNKALKKMKKLKKNK